MINAQLAVCPICRSQTLRELFPDTLNGETPCFDYNFSPRHHRTFRTVRCLTCTHVFSSPIPDNIWQNYVSVQDEAYLRHEHCRLATAQVVCSRLKQLKPSGRLLDIGCATGDFLRHARQYYDVEGLELSAWSADIARKQGFKVHSTFLSDIKASGAYDLITLWGVIEHFQDPVLEVKQMHRLLRMDGIVALWTGDIDGICSKILGKKWWNIQGQHIQDFSRSSLKRLFENHGFKEVWVGIYPCVMSREAILLSMGRYPNIYKWVAPMLRAIIPDSWKFHISVPGELFAVFKKVS